MKTRITPLLTADAALKKSISYRRLDVNKYAYTMLISCSVKGVEQGAKKFGGQHSASPWITSFDESTDMIRPIIFSQPEQVFTKTYRRGSMIWWRRAQFAFMMLLPHLVKGLFGGLSPTVGNVALVARTYLQNRLKRTTRQANWTKPRKF